MRVAVLGTGRIGAFRARVPSVLPEVDEVIVGSRTVGRAEGLAREIGGRAGTIEEAIDSEPDAVFVSLATELHAAALHRCIDAGLPIFCEKPIAPTLPETQSVIEHAERAGNVLQVAFQRRLRAVRARRRWNRGSRAALSRNQSDIPASAKFRDLNRGTRR